MVKGNAPIQMMKKDMGEAAWKEALAVNYPEEKMTGLPIRISSDAWLGVGIK